LSWAFPSDGAPQGPLTLHATTVAVDGRGLLILGPSGSGKSALALELMALGACLVADDRTILTRTGDTLVATCPRAIRGLIEARGIGILNATPCDSATLALAIDLGLTTDERLPPAHQITLLDRPLPLLHKVATGYFAAGLLQYLKAGLAER
jgi:HPr kinase/phosphorylase